MSDQQQLQETPDDVLIPTLPNDVAVHCLARVPRPHHSTLTQVCKSWKATIHSPHFHATRRALSLTEPSLILNLRIFNPKDSTFTSQWHSLITPTVSDPSQFSHTTPQTNPYPFLVSPFYPCPRHPIGASVVFLGHRLYVIGGSLNDVARSDVWVFDFCTSRWEVGPRMRVGREFPAAGVVGGRIYVLGGCVWDNWARSTHWAEVFDPESGVWGPVWSPVEVREKWMHACAVVGGKVFAMADRGGVVFEPGSGEWGAVETELDLGWRGRAAVVDGVLYCYDYLGKIRGFDVEGGGSVWRVLRGVEKGLPKFLCGATMANVGGRLFVVWEGKGDGSGSGSGSGKEVEVHCAEIVVRKDEGSGELWGWIVWSDVILSVPKGSSIVHCLGVRL